MIFLQQKTQSEYIDHLDTVISLSSAASLAEIVHQVAGLAIHLNATDEQQLMEGRDPRKRACLLLQYLGQH
jgi:hypothetical protein